MNPISSLVEYLSGRHAVLRPQDVEHALLRRLHRRLVDALARRDHDSLLVLLATDVDWRHGGGTCRGRHEVAATLAARTGAASLHVEQAHVGLHGDTAVAEALWHHDCPRQGIYTVLRHCVFARQRGYWQVVSLRDLPAPRRPDVAG